MDTLDPAILLVDDDVHVVTTLVAALRDMGHTMVTCRNGLEAVERAAEREFAVILLDVQMPVMDGFDAAEQIRN
ncbi:MAG: response regulator, partial [Armatimonadetes bacterium]|nr:response regulator [Armatimonadota bacterium]